MFSPNYHLICVKLCSECVAMLMFSSTALQPVVLLCGGRLEVDHLPPCDPGGADVTDTRFPPDVPMKEWAAD